MFGWRGRHSVISSIITKYKFAGQDETRGLLKQVVQSISPTYDIEIRTLRQLCSYEGGLAKLSTPSEQNEILRMMISIAPNERVPRHRLISNLIRHGQFADAETEIRIFENDLGTDGPIRRHKVRLTLERAISTTGLLPEDKAAFLNQALTSASTLVERDALAKPNLQLFADVSIELYRLTGDYEYVDEPLSLMRAAESELADPEITRMINRFENRISPVSNPEFETVEIDLD